MDLNQALQQSIQLMQSGRHADAHALLQQVIGAVPQSSDAWQLLGLARKGLGDLSGAEEALNKSLALNPAQPNVLSNLGNVLRAQAKYSSAKGAYERALALTPDALPAQVNLGNTLRDLGELQGSVDVFEALLEKHPQHINGRIGLAQTLQAADYQEAAAGLLQQVVAEQPNNVVALNSLGNSLKVMGYADDAVIYLSRAVGINESAPEVWGNLASALVQADRQDEAIEAYRSAVELDPDNADYHQWLNGYLDVIDHPDFLKSYIDRLAMNPTHVALRVALARKQQLANRSEDAAATLAAGLLLELHDSDRAILLREQSYVLRESEQFDAALHSAREAAKLDPRSTAVRQELANGILAAAGDYAEAVEILRELTEELPNDQGVWGLYATALRYAGEDAQYRRLVDYDRMVNLRFVEPQGEYSDLESFVAELRKHLLKLHRTQKHPVEQSAVNGTQTLDDLLSRKDKVIVALREGLELQLQSVCNALGSEAWHPLYGRNTGEVQFSDSWSVRLHKAGFHKDHFHPEGWLSSAFYVVVPDLVNAGTGEGWIKFGQPGFKAREPLDAEYWVKPVPGALVVFPSYLWHGTVPLSEEVERMTVAYDVLPA